MKELKAWVVLNGGPTAVARKIGVTRQCVNMWLRGQSPIAALPLVKIHKLSSIPVTTLVQINR